MGIQKLQFPDLTTAGAFAEWRSEPDWWLPLVRRLAALDSIQVTKPRAFGTGTNLVVDLNGQVVLKLFPPLHRAQFISERATLRRLADQLSVPTPALVGEGVADAWSWLFMTKLDGIVGSEAWPILPEPEKERILEEIGRAIAEVQAVPVGELGLGEPAWPAFIARQTAGCVERHRRQGSSPDLLADLGRLMAEVANVVPLDQPPVILTGEWIPENFLLSERNGRWRLAAIIDFGDVLTGWREYDLLGPSTFMCAGLPSRLRRLFAGFGLAPDEMDAAMRRRLLTLMMLHRASDLRNLRIDNWRDR